MRRILADTATTASDVGAALVDVTTAYDLTDAEHAELIRQTGKLTVPEPRSTSSQDPHPVHGAY